VRIAHALEDSFVAAQGGHIRLRQEDMDRLLRGVDLLLLIAKTPEESISQWTESRAGDVDMCLAALEAVLTQSEVAPQLPVGQPVMTSAAGVPAEEVSDRCWVSPASLG
jgi:two-component system sensor histidine kinase and response regulator WspE